MGKPGVQAAHGNNFCPNRKDYHPKSKALHMSSKGVIYNIVIEL